MTDLMNPITLINVGLARDSGGESRIWGMVLKCGGSGGSIAVEAMVGEVLQSIRLIALKGNLSELERK